MRHWDTMYGRSGRLGMLLALALLCCLAGPPARAAKTVYPEIYLQSGDRRVILWEYGSNVTFFLPSGFDREGMTLACGGAIGSVTIDGTAYRDGDAVTLDAGAAKHTLKYGKTTYNLRIMQSTQVPSVFLTTASGSLSYIHENKQNKEAGTFRLYDENGRLTLSSPLEHVKGRGNSTFGEPKRPYQIKFSARTSLFGMPAAKRWLLLANHKDHALIRNQILFEAARRLGERYPNDDRYVDLYINSQYLGTYELCQKVEIDSARIDIRDLEKATEALNDDPLDSYPRYGSSRVKKSTVKGFRIPVDPEDITGGYLVVLEKAFHYPENPNGLVTSRGICFLVKSPEYMSEKQGAYIAGELQRLENAIYAKDGRDPETGRHFTELADLDSMVREYLLEEVFKNYDANRSSQYIVKPSDSEGGILYFGPSWDFDLSMGDRSDDKSSTIASPKRMLASNGTGWLPALCKHRVFYERAIVMYYEEMVPWLRALTGLEPDGQTVPLMDRYELLKDSAAMNFTRWPVLTSPAVVNTGTTYEANFTYLNSWLVRRMEYLDTVWLNDYRKLTAE